MSYEVLHIFLCGEKKEKSLPPLEHIKFRKYKVAGNQEESSQTVMTKHKQALNNTKI